MGGDDTDGSADGDEERELRRREQKELFRKKTETEAQRLRAEEEMSTKIANGDHSPLKCTEDEYQVRYGVDSAPHSPIRMTRQALRAAVVRF